MKVTNVQVREDIVIRKVIECILLAPKRGQRPHADASRDHLNWTGLQPLGLS